MLRPSLYYAALKAFRVRNGTFLPFVSLQQASLETLAAPPGSVSGFSFAPALYQIFVFFFFAHPVRRAKKCRGAPRSSRARGFGPFLANFAIFGPVFASGQHFRPKVFKSHSHALARTRTNLHELARTFSVNLKWAFFPHFSENLTICTNLHELARTCTNMHELARNPKKFKKKKNASTHFCPNFSKTAHFAANPPCSP